MLLQAGVAAAATAENFLNVNLITSYRPTKKTSLMDASESCDIQYKSAHRVLSHINHRDLHQTLTDLQKKKGKMKVLSFKVLVYQGRAVICVEKNF